MRRYVVTADRDPNKVGDVGGFRIESVAEHEPATGRTTNVTAAFDLRQVYANDLRRLKQDIADRLGVAADEVEIELI